MSEKKKFYLTTPIYYVNARPHIGHAYSTIVADVLARRHRLLGEDTYFLTGTDEHGQKIERSAAAAGVPPQQFADQVSKTFSDLWKRMGITHDQFIRTTDEKHKVGVQKLFRTLYENGFIELKSYVGSYCVSDEAFVDAPVGTPCPDCGRLLEEVTEENFFFKLSAFQHKLIEEIYTDRLVITPESSKNEVLKFLGGAAVAVAETFKPSDEKHWTVSEGLDKGVEQGLLGKVHVPSADGPPRTFYYVIGALKDLSISRSSFTWGIPVPEDIQKAAGSEQKHVIYVWLDALANYMTALGYGSEDESLWQRFWPADLQLVGKEITRFHCVYWPAFLMAAGLPLPKQVTANGWLLFDNSKMSKSKGNVVRAETILDAFGTLCPPPTSVPQRLKPDSENSGGDTAEAVPFRVDAAPASSVAEASAPDRDLFAADVLRYYLLREIPFGQDGSFSFDSLVTRYNADLANGYGNLVSRTLTLVKQSFDSVVPLPPSNHLLLDGSSPPPGVLGTRAIRIAVAGNTFDLDEVLWKDLEFNRLLEGAANGIGWIDGYFSNFKPWKLAKDDFENSREELAECLYTACESIRIITALLYPILPYATARVWQQLGLGDIEVAAKNGELNNLQWGGMKPGTKLGTLGPIFPRAPKELAQTMADMEEAQATDASKKTQIPSGSDKQELNGRQEGVEGSTHPGAPPRTSTLPEPGTLPVGGSSALSTGPEPVPVDAPLHTTAQPSGIFATSASQQAATPPAAGAVAEAGGAAPESAPQITIDDFAKIELRVAKITLAERIPKADKLLRLEVDLGPFGQRQILSGIAEFYTPEELVGRRIVVITNLAPRKMRGLESHGMLLAASDGDHGKPHLATCGEEIALGSRLK